MTCLHCKHRRACKSRGLCEPCYKDPGVRLRYPTSERNPNRTIKKSIWDHDPTMEELDALIAEQMRPENLPKWWERENGATSNSGRKPGYGRTQ